MGRRPGFGGIDEGEVEAMESVLDTWFSLSQTVTFRRSVSASCLSSTVEVAPVGRCMGEPAWISGHNLLLTVVCYVLTRPLDGASCSCNLRQKGELYQRSQESRRTVLPTH